MKRQFILPSDPILLKVAEAIEDSDIVSPKSRKTIETMLEVAFGEQKERTKPLLVGLAAPQIGISQRIILVDVKANGKGEVGDLRVYINPEIISLSSEKEEWYEGCFSTDRVCGIVSRPTEITISAYDQTGKQVEESYQGYTARIFQHEIDHLNGIEFTSHITDDEDLHWVEEDEFVEYRNNEAWRNWPKKYSREKWDKIKKGER